MCTPGRPVSGTAVDDPHLEAVAVVADGLDHHRAVAEAERVAVVDVADEVVVVDLHHLGRARPVTGCEADEIAVVEHHPALGEVPGPHLGTGQVGQDADLAVERGGRRPNPPQPVEGHVDGLVGQTDAGDVHARLDHLLDGRVGLGGGSDGRDDLGSPGHRPTLPVAASGSGEGGPALMSQTRQHE